MEMMALQAEQNGRHHQQPGYIDMGPDFDSPLNEEIEEQPHDLQQQHVDIVGLLKEVQLPDFRDIYKVPVSVRRVNPECYTPRLVSIGPIHYKNLSLNPMEDVKSKYFNSRRIFIDEPMEVLRECIDLIKENEEIIRSHYDHAISIDSDHFCAMIISDAVFIIELLLKKQENDAIFKNRWWFRDLLHDFLLIENQIPFFVPCMIFEGFYNMNYSFSDLVTTLTKDVNHKNVSVSIASSSTSTKGAMHFIDYLRRAYLNEDNSAFVTFSMPPEDNSEDNSDDASHRLVFMPLEDNSAKKDFQQLLPKKKKYKYDVATASRLFEYGVRFEKGETTSLVDISFDSDKGILTIPQVQVNEWSENLFRNIVAYEQCNLSIIEKKVSDYLIFMDGLIDTAEDVKILIDAKIIQDDLQNPEKVSHMFNNLHKEAITEGREYLFAEQSLELNKYRKNLWHRWTAKWYNWKLILKRDYFNSPWSITAFITAAMLLGLTIFQTICSFYQAKGIQMK